MAQLAQAHFCARPTSSSVAETEELLPTPPRTVSSESEPVDIAPPSRTDRIKIAARTGDVEQLRDMANQAGGYETDELRRIVWPLLLGCDVKGKRKEGRVPLDRLPVREDERQVKLDIARSLINYPRDVSESERDELRLRLEKAILTVLRKHPALQYFQGYHDIVSILMLTLDDDELLASTTEQMSLHRIRDSMGPGLEPTLGYLKLAHRLIKQVDPGMYSLVNQAATMPFFALSWALTLFSHDLYEVAVIARLFDFLLAHNPAMISYLVVAILLTKKPDLVESLEQEDNDPAMVHSVLSQLPNLVLSESVPPRTTTPTTPSSPTKPFSPEYQSEAESEALFSPTASTSDLSSQLTSVGSSSTLDVSDSLISLSEASPLSISALESSPTGLRQRRKATRADRFSFSSFDSDINALDDSMLSDPDVDNPAFSSFPSSSSQDHYPSTTPPLSASTNQNGTTSYSPGNDEFHQAPPRTVLVEDLIESALHLWRTYPLIPSAQTPSAPSSLSDIDSSILASHTAENEDKVISPSPTSISIQADTILGPKSCVFTYESSLTGELSDVEAEEICREGTEIIKLEALLPDQPDLLEEADDDDIEGEDEPEDEEDGFELIGSTPTSSKSRNNRRGAGNHNRKRRKSFVSPSSINGRINLGPHGWLVVGGVAVATAFAYGVYGSRPTGARGAAGGGFGGIGLGTGGLGLRTGLGGGGINSANVVPPNNLEATDGAGELLKGWAARGTNDL